ncbi:lipopolysaccharide transport periplasmic protein LptA [Massilia rhizosphaerae]|uniref:lipopolysaccharide transport periplasmic protein LptA n=1 Tax=Massilia rhizosphaerae TaxID=2784389 RepID=UPI0018DB9109|nr:lipopolysaccharide transport periplasmic protein LptA [Massilia rhizosphaerae]
MKNILAAAIFLLVPLAASAEKADALAPINIKYDKANVDQVTQNYVATGNVIITRGTMVLKSDRAEVKEAPDGYHTFILTADPGKVATFRQKRDGGPDLWDEGQAQRIEYDERNDLLKLFSKAMIRQLEGKKVTQEMDNEFISYDNRREVLVGRNDATGADKPGNGRGSITLQPHRTPAPAAPAAPTPAGKQ